MIQRGSASHRACNASRSGCGLTVQFSIHSSWSPWKTGRPVRAASAFAKVLLPEPLMPTTATRSGFIPAVRGAERRAHFLRELPRHQSVGAREIRLELFLRQTVETVEPHPLGARQIGRGNNAALFCQDVKAHLVRLERDALRIAPFRLCTHRGEHLAADLEDMIVAPLDRQGRA